MTRAMTTWLARALFVVIAGCVLPAAAGAQETPSGPGRDAPAGVMNSMLHSRGEWMVGVRLMTTSMDGNRSGRRSLTDDEVFAAGYDMAPQRMTMPMPSLDVMYGATDRVTLTATVPFVISSMDMRMMSGEAFVMRAHGISDLRAGAMLGLWRGRRQDLHFYAGAQLPLGSINSTDNMPDCGGCKVDYVMQPGSGTLDLTPGLTWVREGRDWSWGANWLSVLRTGTNSEGYTLGDRHDFSAWGVRHLNQNVSASVRIAASRWGNIAGAEPEFDPRTAPTQDPGAQGGRRMDVVFGVGLRPIIGPKNRDRLSIEVGRPIVESLDGPQLATSWIASMSWQMWWR